MNILQKKMSMTKCLENRNRKDVVADVNIEEIKKDYKAGIPKKEIITKHHITIGQLNYQIVKNKWQRRKRKGTKGNKGGHGTKGNQNAVVTGAYSKIINDCFSPEELEFFNDTTQSQKEILQKEINTLAIREFRMLNKIQELRKKNKDLTIMRMSKYGTTTSTEAENTQMLIIRFEEALTKVQEAKRRALDSLHKIEIENKRFDLEANKDKNNQEQLDKLDEVLKNIGGVI